VLRRCYIIFARILAKKNTPDKKWVKLAFCLNRMMRALKLGPAHHSIENDLTASPEVVDASCWSSFVSLIGKISKSREQLGGFVRSLVDSLDVLRSGRQQSQDVCIVATLLERLLADNQLPVLLRGGHASPLPDTSDEAVPHYQLNDIRPDHRSNSVYAVLLRWLRAALSAVNLHEELSSTVAPPLPGTSEETAHVPFTMFDYVQCCALLDKERMLQQFGSSGRSPLASFPSAVGRLLCDLLAHAQEDSPIVLLDDFVCSLRRSGATPTAHNSTVEMERRKAHNRKYLEQVVCVLVEFNERLGGTAESLVPCVLPLCALQMWKAAELVLTVCQKSPTVSVNSSCLKSLSLAVWRHMVQSPGATGSAGLLSHTCARLVQAQNALNSDADVAVVTPLHFAVRYDRKKFVVRYVQTFRVGPLDLVGLVQFALRVHAVEVVPLLLAHSDTAHCSSTGLIVPPVTLGFRPSVELCSREQHRQAQYLSVRGCSRRQSRALKHATLLTAALQEADRQCQHVAASSPAHIGLFVTCTDPFSLKRLVQLMDGTEAEWETVLNDADMLALALPSPASIGGFANTGHTVLHQACRLGDVDVVQELLSLNPCWIDHALSVDRSGHTPLGIAVAAGNLDLARMLLVPLVDKHCKDGQKPSLVDLYRTHTAGDVSSRADIARTILCDAERKLQDLQSQLDVPPVPGVAVPRVLRGYQVHNAGHALVRHLQHVEKLWKQIGAADPHALLHVAHLPASAQLDSVIRVRQALALLGIPLSQLVTPPVHVGRTPLSTQRPTAQMKDFTGLGPQKLRKLVSWPCALQLKSLICGWYRLRSAAPPSALDDTLFLFRNVDVPICDQGRAATEASRFLRQQAAYVRACDRVRAKGVPYYDVSHGLASLGEQLKQEMRFDVASAARENILRRTNLPLLGEEDEGRAQMTNKVQSVLRTMQVEATTCSQTLDLAYLVLDFCRSVCIARLLVAATAEPQQLTQGGKMEAHPLDSLQERVAAARSHLARLRPLLTGDAASPGGVLSTIRICDELDTSQLAQFLTLPNDSSKKFSTARGFVVEGLSCLLQDRGQFQLSEFLCRVVASGNSTGVAVAQPAEIEEFAPDSAAATKATAAGARGVRIADDAEGYTKLLQFLQHVTVKDLVYGLSGKPTCARFQEASAARIQELNERSGTFLAYQSGEFLEASRDRTRADAGKATETEQQLRAAYSTATALYRFIAAALYLPTQRSLYDSDVAMLVENHQDENVLGALCASGLPWSDVSGDVHVMATRCRDRGSLAAARKVQLDVSDRLLRLGAQPCTPQKSSVAPVEAAAVSGNADLVRAFLAASDHGALHSLRSYSTLVWYTLLASVLPEGKDQLRHDYAAVVQLLLEHGFPTAAPPHSDYSVLEVALIVQAPHEVLAALVARRVPMSVASGQRAMQWLLLRESSAPVQVAEALLYEYERSKSDTTGWIHDAPKVLHNICSAEFDQQVLEPTPEFFHPVDACHAGASSMERICSSLRDGICTALSDLGVDRRRRCVHNKRVGGDIERCCALLRSGAHLQGNNEEARDTLLLTLAQSRQHAVVAFVMQHLHEALLSACNLGADGDLVVSSDSAVRSGGEVKLRDVLCTACYYDNLPLVKALARLHTEWSAQKDVTGDVSDADGPLGVSWESVLNCAGDSAELGAGHTPLMCALVGRAETCIKYLCAQPGLSVTYAHAVSAVAKYSVSEATALVLLQSAVPAASAAYDAAEFLSATEHVDVVTGRTVVSGETFLHLCCRRGYATLVEHLLLLGADAMVEDGTGTTALQCSIASGHGAVTRTLYSKCPDAIKSAVNTIAYAARKALLRRWRVVR
jgi:ankyrin repeat protein